MVGIEGLWGFGKEKEKPKFKKDLALAFFLTIDLIITSFLLLGLDNLIIQRSYPNLTLLVIEIILAFIVLLFFVYLQVRMTKYRPIEEYMDKRDNKKEIKRATKQYNEEKIKRELANSGISS